MVGFLTCAGKTRLGVRVVLRLRPNGSCTHTNDNRAVLRFTTGLNVYAVLGPYRALEESICVSPTPFIGRIP